MDSNGLQRELVWRITAGLYRWLCERVGAPRRRSVIISTATWWICGNEPGMELEAGWKTCQKRQASGSVEWEGGGPGEDEGALPTVMCGDGP